MKIIKWIVPIMIIFLFAPVSMAEEANTIDDLLGMFDESNCKDCHPEQYNQWQESFHARAVVSSLGGMNNFFETGVPKEWERKLTKVEVLKCLDCHAPVVNYASEELAVKIADMIIDAWKNKDEKARKELSRLNVGCLACHNIKATAPARGLLGEPERGTIYTPNMVISPAHKTDPVNTMNKSLFCAQCHGRYVSSDGEQIMCNTLSGSYYNAYRSLGGLETCQDCHMNKNNRGHRFPGGHDLEIVKEGIGFTAEISGVRHTVGEWTPRAIVNVGLENRAGHRIPDG